MKTISKRKGLTLGQLVVAVYDGYGKQRGAGIIRLAINAGIIAFLGRQHIIVT